jgi:hypothetical protein
VQGFGKFIVLGSLLAGSAFAALAPLSRLDAGRPGCWNRIHAGALTDQEVKDLPKDCKDFREDYFASIEAAKKDPAAFEKKLVMVLKRATKARAPYEAIFFATLIHSEGLVAALKIRAATEAKLKVPFQYATVALYRLSGKECVAEPKYGNVFYREVCQGEDSILPTYFQIAGGKK